MNNAPLTLILIASLGIVAVISLGVFFAVRPKFAGTEEHLAADVFDQQQLYSSDQPQLQSSQPSPPSPLPQQPRTPSNIAPPSTPPVAEFTPPIGAVPAGPPGSTPARPLGTGLPHNKPDPSEPRFSQSSRQSSDDREIVSTVELLDSLRVPPGFGNDQQQQQHDDTRATSIGSESSKATTSTLAAGTTGKSDQAVKFRELGLVTEVDMHRYGKIVGLAYRKGRLYVPSYQNGNVSVFKADTMQLTAEYTCQGCHIYDIGVLSNGDMVLAQGKYAKLTKLSNRTGAVVKEVTVAYSTKGVAVSTYDEIFVLSRDQDSIYVYDSDLKQLGVLPLENEAKNDCNFLAYGADVIYVSCESSTKVVDVQGKQIQTLKPPPPQQGATVQYDIGVAVNGEDGAVYVGQRGKSMADVFDKNGRYVQTVGENKNSLWSDVVVDGKHLFVIEYITTTIKQYRLR